jgi:hypothetical protein
MFNIIIMNNNNKKINICVTMKLDKMSNVAMV